jgi:hypothetical protein
MPESVCTQHGGPVSFSEASFARYACAKSKADNKRASQAETFGCSEKTLVMTHIGLHRHFNRRNDGHHRLR